jgi:hypothetical protein
MTRRDGGSDSPKSLSNFRRSLAIVGEPNESTMAMVRPRPSCPWAYSGFMS